MTQSVQTPNTLGVVMTQLVQIDQLSHLLKVIKQVKDPKPILTNILDFILIGVGCETNLTLWKILHSTHLTKILPSKFLSFDIPLSI